MNKHTQQALKTCQVRAEWQIIFLNPHRQLLLVDLVVQETGYYRIASQGNVICLGLSVKLGETAHYCCAIKNAFFSRDSDAFFTLGVTNVHW